MTPQLLSYLTQTQCLEVLAVFYESPGRGLFKVRRLTNTNERDTNFCARESILPFEDLCECCENQVLITICYCKIQSQYKYCRIKVPYLEGPQKYLQRKPLPWAPKAMPRCHGTFLMAQAGSSSGLQYFNPIGLSQDQEGWYLERRYGDCDDPEYPSPTLPMR